MNSTNNGLEFCVGNWHYEKENNFDSSDSGINSVDCGRNCVKTK